jgi:hypothetical protein
MRLSVVVPALAAVGLAASMGVVGLSPAQAEGVGSGRAAATHPAEYTIMGDSHLIVMINDLFPGAYANGKEGTRIDQKFAIYALNGIKLHQVVNGRGIVKAGVSAVGTTNVDKWRKALRTGPDTVVVNLGTNDGGPTATDIDKFMRIVGKDRRVFWVKPYYTSCPPCRVKHDLELKAAANRFPNLKLIKVNDLGLHLSSDGLHAFGKANSQALWNRIQEVVIPPVVIPPVSPEPAPTP